ncbi:glycosyltransferase family 2 protein [candidate division KSB1 bacterium]|nr:glycosyltransferase family 2 protein [candidate division KSB1 bacterium]RQW06297.1 MAG: glycosyltransferase family 2 protein [candidate division KSB1 bacterium]
MDKKNLALSIFYPVYNDWGTIASMVVESIITAEKISDDYEIILVDDGSRDKTKDILAFLQNTFPQVKVITHTQNHGYGGALKSGFEHANKDFIFYTDGDAQYDVRELVKLAAAMNDHVDVVNGWKIKRHDPFYRVWIGKLYQYVSKVLFQLPIRDVDCDFRLLRKSVFDNVRLVSKSGTICVEMIHKLSRKGARFVEVPVTHYFRASGKSEFFNLKRLLRVARDYTKLWFRLVIFRKED